ncbi:hypothetical protein TrVFT333_006817 [Trichoderma virens FT-333]|nr:hypothetical protein TrVFT333_006817 [Trichoderma virens FT-333]
MARCRSRINKDPVRGMRNRQYGLSSKAHFFHNEYNADVLVVIRRPDGQYAGYQSKPGLLRRFQSVPDDQLSGPPQFIRAQESDSDGASQRSMRSSSFTSSTSADSANTPSLTSDTGSLSSHEAPSPVDIPPPAPTPPSMEVPMTILPSIEMSPIDPDTFLSFLSNDETSLSDNEITELLWSNVVESSESAELNDELPRIIQPSPVNNRQREAILSLLDQYF